MAATTVTPLALPGISEAAEAELRSEFARVLRDWGYPVQLVSSEDLQRVLSGSRYARDKCGEGCISS